MKSKKIIVSVTNDLTNDQRVNRICNSLQNNGYNIVLIGRKLKNSNEIYNRSYKTKRFRLPFNSGVLFFISFNIRLFFYLISHKSDILLSNDLDTLLCNAIVAKLTGSTLVYDTHELFTEAPEIENSKIKKKIWLNIEKRYIKRAKAAYTVSQPIADFYNKKYNINMQLVRNLPTKKNLIISYGERENILIYQGALNTERGIELLIQSLAYLSDFKLIIAGKGYMANKLKNLTENLNLTDRVIFTGNLDFEELHNTTSKAKLGFSIEQGSCLNYYYALPNKIFDYIQAGVPFICSNFPEMKKIVDTYNVGEIFKGNSPKDLSEQILQILSNNDKIIEYYNNCLIAKDILNWENEEKKLLEIYSKL